MANKDQKRIVELQRTLKIAKDALTRIKHGCRSPECIADEALYRMMPLDKALPLQGLVGHERGAAHD